MLFQELLSMPHAILDMPWKNYPISHFAMKATGLTHSPARVSVTVDIWYIH